MATSVSYRNGLTHYLEGISPTSSAMPIDATYKAIDWTIQRQAVLEQYIKVYLSKLVDPSRFYKDLDWKYISRSLDLDDHQYVLLKIDELLDDYLYGIQGVAPVIWKSNDNSLFQQVNQLIDALGLEKDRQVVQSKPPRVTTARPKEVRSIHSPPTNPLRKERRSSLELLPRPTGFKNGASLSKGDASMTKPAETSTSNINVITRAEVNYRPAETSKKQPQVLNRFKGVQNRLMLLGKKKEPKLPPTPQLPNSPNSPREIPNFGELALTERNRRRLSVVGMNLPMYIRKQLQEEVIDGSAVIDVQDSRIDKPKDIQENINHMPVLTASPVIDERAPREIATKDSSNESSKDRSPKKNTRLQNLLSNSQSLYSHAKDVSESADNGNVEDESEEEDKEYILPNLLTRFYGAQLEDSDSNDEVLRALDEDDVDFVNVNESYDEFGVVPEDQDDDYLFKV
ncbi:uncharacterized protein CANTADRAFT_87932 [Suhomyces tanzawaensis NRRL Y-17324]|uniref:Uncharacterized protein n=1 Tax=Suhomyces tanzawaensis NRRL Y-17324 TaxID=984487 RepID=A0A1E4SR55_9ASCO|nr:uncharacterized protein CANTADRAFT_87932 [Suhomyces tanzawaensis NRRL Y-17324]ODV81989.1 hypothetical protein CANTADRAFT_87932 [Suhomyces tanzawaensis NRRL Y-17324]